MTNIENTQKQGWIEEFNTVAALYYVLKSNGTSLRVKQAVYRQDEVPAHPLDFIIDVELKSKRALGEWYYQMFIRAIQDEITEILPVYMKEMLGKLFKEYRLGPDGPYAKLFFDAKNAQVRSFMREAKSGRTESTNGTAEPAGV